MKCQSRFTQTSNGLVSPRINTVLWSNGIISVCKSTFSTNGTKKVVPDVIGWIYLFMDDWGCVGFP